MKLMQKAPDGSIGIYAKEYRNMNELRQDMRNNPHDFNKGDYRFTLIEERPWLRIVEETNIKVEEVG